MTKRLRGAAPFPSRDDILEFVRGSSARVGKREIARAFNLDADQKMLLKKELRAMQQEGLLHRGTTKQYSEPGTLPEVTMVVITGIDEDGDVTARPLVWDDIELGKPPVIRMAPEKKGRPGLGINDRVLARLSAEGKGRYVGRTIKRVASAPAQALGIVTMTDGAMRIQSVDRRHKSDLIVPAGNAGGAKPGDLVRAEILPGKQLGLRKARIVERLEDVRSQRSISLVALHEHDIPIDFTPEAHRQAEGSGPASMGKRVDLRRVPLVTIDGEDARDFDDAVWAEADDDAQNPDGWHLIVAIADVAWYVRPGDALDKAAFERGNSVYLPDRVVPMLPESLSNGWCCLRPHEDRPCLAAHMWIDKAGKLKRHRFERAMMHSHARLTYGQVQAAMDGQPDETTAPLLEPVIAPLYGAYRALRKARDGRGVLELEMPERRVVFDDGGNVVDVALRERHDSHKLIEEFMITANVAAAETLEKARQNCMYRIHDSPSLDKMESLRQVLADMNLSLAKGRAANAGAFNKILEQVAGKPEAPLVNEMILRSQSQAVYAPGNIGHFGLALRKYCHFTSPIRRYADLLVHRALIRGLKLGEGGLEDAPRDFVEMGEHISVTERRAASAERKAMDRFVALYLIDRVGAVFEGRITGVTRFGLFVSLTQCGGDGLVPMGLLPDDTYELNETKAQLRGYDSGHVYRLGQTVEVLLAEANPATGGLILHLLNAPSSDQRPHKAKRPTGKRHKRPTRRPRR